MEPLFGLQRVPEVTGRKLCTHRITGVKANPCIDDSACQPSYACRGCHRHKFHRQCLLEYQQTAGQYKGMMTRDPHTMLERKNALTCPMCREPMPDIRPLPSLYEAAKNRLPGAPEAYVRLVRDTQAYFRGIFYELQHGEVRRMRSLANTTWEVTDTMVSRLDRAMSLRILQPLTKRLHFPFNHFIIDLLDAHIKIFRERADRFWNSGTIDVGPFVSFKNYFYIHGYGRENMLIYVLTIRKAHGLLRNPYGRLRTNISPVLRANLEAALKMSKGIIQAFVHANLRPGGNDPLQMLLNLDPLKLGDCMRILDPFHKPEWRERVGLGPFQTNRNRNLERS